MENLRQKIASSVLCVMGTVGALIYATNKPTEQRNISAIAENSEYDVVVDKDGYVVENEPQYVNFRYLEESIPIDQNSPLMEPNRDGWKPSNLFSDPHVIYKKYTPPKNQIKKQQPYSGRKR